MKLQATLEDLSPAGGILAIIAGILLIVMVPQSIPASAPSIEYYIVYGFGMVLIIAGAAAVWSAFG